MCYYDNKNEPEKTSQARKLSLSAGFEYNVVYPYKIKKTDAAEYAFKQASQNGKVALSIECGKLGITSSQDVAKITNGIYSILNASQMIAFENVNDQKKQIIYNNQYYVKAPVTGIFFSNYKSGETVKKNSFLGYITDEFGNQIAALKAPENGIILYKTGTPPLSVGETVFCIAN